MCAPAEPPARPCRAAVMVLVNHGHQLTLMLSRVLAVGLPPTPADRSAARLLIDRWDQAVRDAVG